MSLPQHEHGHVFPSAPRPSWLALYEHAPVGFCEVSAAGVVVAINQTLLSWLGYGWHEVSGDLTFDVLLTTAGRERFRELETRCQAEGKVEGIELEFRSGAGEHPLVGQVDATGLFDSQGHFLGWRGSVSEHTRGEAYMPRRLQPHSSEAIERLAGRAARKFAELLLIILDYTHLGRSKLRETHPIYSQLLCIKAVAQRGVELAQALEAFSGRQQLQQQIIDLHDLLSSVAAGFQVLCSSLVGLSFRLNAQHAVVYADQTQLQQALLHVVANACAAMPQGGMLTIETENAILDEAYRQQHLGVVPGEYICASVTDTGIGMDPETLAHMFEPFFTTKELGTGLGLSVVWGTIKQHRGHLEVSSQPSRGTTLRIYLPVVEGGEQKPVRPPPRGRHRPARRDREPSR